MGKQVKGCVTKGCISNKKKIKYKYDDNFCLKCGESLVPVCKKCYVPLPANYYKKICERCIAEKEDKKDRNVKNVQKAGAGVAGIAGVAVAGKQLLDVAKKMIK